MASDAYRVPRGTRDLLPEDLIRIQHLERTARRVAHSFRYSEIRTPLIEETRLFTRSLGEASDVVEKEMFTVPPRAEGSISHSLRPEGTASAARAYIQGGFAARAPFQKWFYLGPMFRYERPQKGRERQFLQFGVEVFGASSPSLDAEVVDLAMRYFEALGFGSQLEVRVNTMGDPQDRALWSEALRAFFASRMEPRCADCQARLERNVFRLLDCKVAVCQAGNAGAPSLRDGMNLDSAQHHDGFLAGLKALGREVVDDPTMIRGLDYYTRTVFEVHCPSLGARSALCGGGRYDDLVAELGGTATPAVGFAIGLTGTELAMATLSLPSVESLQDLEAKLRADVYVVAIAAEDRSEALALAGLLRCAGVGAVELDHRNRSAKAQFKEADKNGARAVLVVGADERATDAFVLRDMADRSEKIVARADLVAAVSALLKP